MVYTLGKHFASTSEIPLFVEDPSFIGSVVDLETLEVNHDGIGLLRMQKKSQLTWGDRLEQGVRVLLPVCYPKDEHWLLVVLSRLGKRVYIKVWDSMHKYFAEFHESIVKVMVKAMQLMGGVGESISFKPLDQTTPLEQRHSHNFCGFHVLMRIWMESTGQKEKKIKHYTVDLIRRYVQYMILSKEVGVGSEFVGEQEESGEEEFRLV